MFQIEIKRTRDRRPLNRLLKRIQELHNQSASIGYFKEQGLHKDSNMPYASLLYIHAYGYVDGAPVRDVLGNIKPFLGGGANQKQFFLNILKDYFKKGSRVTVGQVMDRIGRKYMEDGKNVFGNPTILEVTNNPTPLVDTSDLKDHFAYRTSIDMKVVTS